MKERLYNDFFECDVSNVSLLTQTWQSITNKYGKVDILINNAAIARGKLFKELSFEEYFQTIKVNFGAYVHLTKMFLEN
jgi:short-subunit dehydrogenase